ncbi:unnamed protein product [Durusdinium trenchii]|uniref:Uncharacterized protein n=2 Tax=Durusdinium trenchii TaxID=1381693 RepID=A0ABP0QMM0_9DINO
MSEGSIQWENVSNISVAYPLEPSDLELGSVQLHWTERIKHQILLLRLQRPYFIYCLMCSFIAATAFLSTLIDLCFGSEKGWHDILEGGTWQSACWSAVSLALFAEVLSNLFINWPVKSFSQDWWLIFDVTLLVLTVFAWALSHWRRATIMREEAEEADLWLIFLRFALQPCRVFASAANARKVQQMQKGCVDIKFDGLGRCSNSSLSGQANRSE